jgi:hypothetical protein
LGTAGFATAGAFAAAAFASVLFEFGVAADPVPGFAPALAVAGAAAGLEFGVTAEFFAAAPFTGDAVGAGTDFAAAFAGDAVVAIAGG